VAQPAAALELDTRQGRLGGLAWRRPGAPRVLCLHGWLDNAASFAPLAEHCAGLDLVALDLPGHGHSEHRHASTRYHFIDYVFNIDAALDALGWDQCHFLGHSMGGAIASIYAAGAPERVRSLVLLDGLGPMTSGADRTTERLRRSLAKYRKGASEPRRYGSLDEMVQARRRVSPYLSERAAHLLCERSARPVEGGFAWRSDPALNWVSAVVMTEEQVLDLLRHVVAPTLALAAEPPSPWIPEARVAERRRALAHARFDTVAGHHHFHMDDPGRIAETVQSFVLRNDQPAKGTHNHE